jgi:ribonuclease HI
MNADHYLAYADGSCIGNPGPGGWGVVIIMPAGLREEHSGGAPRTTNNRMEMTAAIEALRRLPEGVAVTLRSDSEYLVKSINLKWRRNANLDLWRELDRELGRHRVRLEWVRGHADDELNNRADQLAQQEARVMAGSGGAPPTSRPPSINLSAELGPLLAPGERLEKCAACERLFVAANQAAPAYCNHAACQLAARRRLASRP